MNYMTEIKAFHDNLKNKDFGIDNDGDYKMLLLSLNMKRFWRSNFLYPETIYFRKRGGDNYILSGVMPINSIYELLDKATLHPVSNLRWEYNQIRKMMIDKNLGGKEPSYLNFLPLWQSHCKRTFRWNIAWKTTPQIVLNELIPTERMRLPRNLRDKIVKSCNSTCQYCGKLLDSKDIHVDHITPVCQGGKTVFDNLTVACSECNLKKGGRTPEQANMKLF